MTTTVDSSVERPTTGALIATWYRPITSSEPWAATGYLLVSGLASLVWMAAATVVLGLSLLLTVIVVGVPLAIALLGLLVRLGSVERRRAAWMSGRIAEAPRPATGRGWENWTGRLADPVRWRAVLYFLLAPIVFWLLFALTVASWALPLYLVTLPLWGWAVGIGAGGLLSAVVVGVALGGIGPRMALVFADLGRRFTDRLLGQDRVTVMQQRVDSLAANRAEILGAVAAERRRIERNLHDGVQQHLIALGIDLGLAASKVENDPAAALDLLAAAREKNRATIGELRTIGRGLHPAVLDDRGLDAALSSVVGSSAIPIALEVDEDLELPIDTAETAYFVVSEAVANMLKHARARAGSVRVTADGGGVRIVVRDDGRGGADPSRGTGLAGIAARVTGVDGSMQLDSPPGGPTVVTVELPHG